MQNFGLVRRILGDILGLLLLAGFAAIVVYLWPGKMTASTFESLFLPVYGALALVGYTTWVSVERKAPRLSWLFGTACFIGAGVVSLAGDVIIGHLSDPSAPITKAPLKAGIPFGVTLCLFALVLVALAGWARSLVVRVRSDSQTNGA
jgi:hypothetical protein